MVTETVPLFEKYRPKSLDDVAGQDKAVAQLRGIEARTGFGGKSFWISGPSGCGKTTLARIIAGKLADKWAVSEFDSGSSFRMADVEQMKECMGMYGLGRGGRAWIVNEAHGISAAVSKELLGISERLPAHVVLIFTTTWDGQELLLEGIDGSALLSRCVRVGLTNQGLAQAFAKVVQAGAQSEGLDGLPLASYVKLLQRPDVKNNCRAAWNLIESGVMLVGGAA